MGPSDRFRLGVALPLVLTNGWPSTALELVDLARRVGIHPTAVAVFPHDLARPPRSWAERT